MSRPHDPSHFTETTLPRQDYMARGLGYGVAAVTVMVGYLLEYFDQRVFAVALVSLLYPHLVFILSRPFEKKKRATRKLLIHIDAFLFGIFLGFLHLPMEIAGLFLFMINTSFIVVGSVTAWVSCVISLAAGVSAGILIFGFHTAPPAPQALFMTAAYGAAMHLAVTAYSGNRRARALIRLKQRFPVLVDRFQASSRQVAQSVAPQLWETIFSVRRRARLETQRKK